MKPVLRPCPRCGYVAILEKGKSPADICLVYNMFCGEEMTHSIEDFIVWIEEDV
jgi:hypothetical protein